MATYGIVFRVVARHRARGGRLAVHCDDFGATELPRDVADLAASKLPGGRVVPYRRAERMEWRVCRRRMGWPFGMRWAGLPAR